MHQLFVRLGLASALALMTCSLEAQAQSSTLPPSQVARKLGITVQQVQSLEAQFRLTDDQLLALPRVQLQLMLEDLDHPGVAKHQGQQQFEMLRLKDEHGQIPPDGLLRAMEHRHQMPISPDLFPATPDPSPVTPNSGTAGPNLAGIQNNGWTWLGPGNIGGRVRSLVVHPTVTSTLWCGGVDGGVWKSTNSGAGWFPLNDFMANLAVACLVLDPTNPNLLYAGTGEAMYNGDAIRGAGIFKTTDGGTTWYQLPATVNGSFRWVGRLAVCPTNHLVLLAATRSGVFRSVDGGTNWSQQLSTECVDIAYHPTDGSQALASGYDSQAFYSLDGGLTWTPASGFPSTSGFAVGRIELAYAPSSPNVVYASLDNNSGEIYSSSDGGQTFSLRNTGNGYLGSQGWYDNVLWVDPTTPNVVVVGGIDLWRSTDGGASLTQISQWQLAPSSAHADHHAIVSVPNYDGSTVRTVYFGNDGGVYRASDVYNVSQNSGWQELNNNLGITQFYGGAGNVSSGTIVGGTQDNGSLRYTPAAGAQGWTAMFGGDGGFSAADPTDPNYFYGEYVYLQIHRSTDGGSSSSYITSGLSDAGSAANFIAPFILDPNNPNTMLGGGDSLWRSTNVKSSFPSWSAIKPPANAYISAIAVAPGNSDIIWVGHNDGSVYSTANGTAASPTWTQRNSGLPGRYCGRIAVNPFNPNKVYVTFGGYNTGNVWRSTDGGVTWTDISGNLPAAPVNSLVIAPGVTNTLYVGTDVGIFGTTSDGGTWSTGNDGPANVATDELFWMGNKLIAVTHGRGMFSITPAIGGVNLVAAGSAVLGGNGNGQVDPNECNLVYLTLQNTGGSGATNLTATLTSTTLGVSIVQGVSAYPNLAAAGGAGTNSTPFQISTAPGFVCGTPVNLNLSVVYNGTSNSTVAFSPPSGGGNYTVSTSTGASIVPGITDIGNHGDDVVTTITLPFSWAFYGRSFTNATLSSNGNLQFLSGDNYYANSCLPYSGFNYAISPFWDDLRTDGTGSGIFTSVSGSAPNRIFNIEWRAAYYSSQAAVNFEVRLYEGQPRFDIIYGTLNGTGSTATVGAQSDTGSTFLNYECNAGGLSAGLQLSFNSACTDGGGACPVGPTVNFTASPTTGAAPLTVYFTNLTTGATHYTWDFGDTHTSAATNPANVYQAAGTYSVTLSAGGGGVTNSFARTGYIVVTNRPAQLVVTPASLNFGSAFIGTTAQASLVLSNAGGTTLTGNASLGGGPFAFGPGANPQLSIAAQGSTNLPLTFSPGGAGSYSNVVIFVTSGGNATNALLGVGASLPLIVQPAKSSTNFVFFFATLTGKTYTVQYKNALDNSPWLTAQVYAGNGATNEFSAPVLTTGQRFYRLSVQ